MKERLSILWDLIQSHVEFFRLKLAEGNSHEILEAGFFFLFLISVELKNTVGFV